MRIGLTNQMRASVTKSRSSYKKPESAASGAVQEDIRGSIEGNHETNGRTSGEIPGSVHSRRRGSACDSLQGDGHTRIVGMDSHGHKRTVMDAIMVSYLHLL